MPAEQQRSMEAQMRELYADREALEEALGTSRVDDIISTMRALREERDALRERVEQLEAAQRAAPRHEPDPADTRSDAAPQSSPQNAAPPSGRPATDEPPSKSAPDAPASQAPSAPEREKSMHKIVHKLFSDAQLEAQWNEVVADWRDEAPGEAQAAIDWVRDLRDDLLDGVDTIDDPLELEEALAVQYIQYKSTWIMLNTKLQYQMMRHGAPDFGDFHRASLITSLIAKLEEIMPNDEVRQIEAFLSDPVSRPEIG